MSHRREPVRTGWIWIVFAILFALINPWYFPGDGGPLVAGVPLWALVILAASAALAGFIHYVVARHWLIEDADDE